MEPTTSRLRSPWIVMAVAAFLAAACSSNPPPVQAPNAGTLPGSNTPSPLPTHTAAPTTTPAPTETPVPTATPTPHPLTIQSMREREYPGSDVVIEQTLDPG